ncbi:uncharacterized protein LOC106711843 [Papilio machaon]|uniref:uncharacterized protein LOC106711843 n=1 Tax=Papilio machaon TaxID=76193 RepID=UPI001E663C5D|nr:uncharacterized protein LOC106711843 [Papilio machaon]
MNSKCFIMNINNINGQSGGGDTKPPLPKEKVISYEEKSVGSTVFFKCEACPYMALAEDDIKFHLFTVHPDLAKTNGLADNIQISCPGCTSVFDAEETLRNHLRNHHKMGIKDVRKMVKSLVQIALKNAKLKKEDKKTEDPPPSNQQDLADIKIPQIIEIVPDSINPNNESLPKGVAYISVDELNSMSTPNFEKVDPKEVIQGASINIVYSNDVSTQYVNVSEAGVTNGTCNLIQVSSVTPDLISSIPRIANVLDNSPSPQSKKDNEYNKSQIPVANDSGTILNYSHTYDGNSKTIDTDKKLIKPCGIGGCYVRLKDDNNMAYHRKCHQNGKLQCPECAKVCPGVDPLHTHLWKVHAVDMELPTCEICGFKTFKKYRLYNIHMKCHGSVKAYTCTICTKSFKNSNQFSKHNLIHKRDSSPAQCHICQKEFSNERKLRAHINTVHDKLRPFKCSHCDYTAARKGELKLHLRSHTGDKPYSCNQCNYRSADHNAMRRHKRMHTKEGVYKCKYCPYTAIQSTIFTSHMISKHPNVNSSDVHCCPYCPFKSVSKEKYVVHLTTHRDKEGIQLLVDMKTGKTNKPSWTIPSNEEKSNNTTSHTTDPNKDSNPNTVNTIPIEVYDCDSLSESMPQEYPKNYCTTPTSEIQTPTYNSHAMVTDLRKVESSSDCLISESSNDTMMDRHQYTPQRQILEITYDENQSNLHEFLNTTVSMEQKLLQNSSVNSLASNHSPMSNNIMGNFPIRLPPVPLSLRNNIMLKPADKISMPMTKVTGPIIKPTQILPVPSSSHSPINISSDPEGAPKKKAKISVKSNLILKGPDQENMFHSQQKMAFKRLEDNERFGLGGPVTFNNLITTQFMQLQPEPVLSESPNNIMAYPQENMLEDAASTPVDNEMNDNPQIFTFNQQMNVNTMTILPPPPKIQANDPSYIKLEATIKQNTQSPCLERMCTGLNTQIISREYKASPPLEEIHKNIKNEVKSDSFYNMGINNTSNNPSMIDQYLMDMGEQYSGHMDLSNVVLPEISDQQNDVIEIDDNSDDTKMLPRFDMNFPLESLYLMHNDFHFLENDITSDSMPDVSVNEINRMVTEIPIINQKEVVEIVPDISNNEYQNFQGNKDPMMNTSVRPMTKINVKNIELMKN